MEVQELIAGFASLAHKDANEFLSTLKDDNGEQITDPKLVFEHVKSGIQERLKSTGQNQLKRGQSDVKKEVAAYIKGLGLELELNPEGTAADYASILYEAMKKQGVKEVIKTVPGAVDITPELLESNPVAREYFSKTYQGKIEEKQAALEAERQQLENERKGLKLNARRTRIKEQLLGQLVKDNVTLEVAGDPTIKRDLRVSTFVNNPLFSPENWGEKEDGTLYPIDEKGNHRQTDEFREMDMSDLIKVMNPFGYSNKDASKGSPQPPTKGTPPKAGAKIVFKDEKEFYDKFNNERDATKKKEYANAWRDQNEEAA